MKSRNWKNGTKVNHHKYGIGIIQDWTTISGTGYFWIRFESIGLQRIYKYGRMKRVE